ncbi:MAG: NUDIX domain-containing protein [Saprospiraceae bacterium]|nr:NUDIX domain-containing protein [Saprospiraceae bacterium]
MYKIYYNEHLLVFADHLPDSTETWSLISRYRGKVKALFTYIDLLEKRIEKQNIWIVAEHLDQLWSDFKSLLTPIEAAGGLVIHPDGAWLFIDRRAYLDLPKGKVDPGENLEEAAQREVLEETGIQAVINGPSVWTTWHIYREKKTRFLKKTTWYYMKTDDTSTGVPQAEEGITALLWLNPKEYLASKSLKYRSLTEMIRELNGIDPFQ